MNENFIDLSPYNLLEGYTSEEIGSTLSEISKRTSAKLIDFKVADGVTPPEKINQGDWIDLRAGEDVEMKAGEFKCFSLGIAMKLPQGYEAHIVPRSSTFKNFGIIQTNSMGVVDNSYCGDEDWWRFPAFALRDTIIHKNDRICQFRIVKNQEYIIFNQVDSLGAESRGGFGSTGIN